MVRLAIYNIWWGLWLLTWHLVARSPKDYFGRYLLFEKSVNDGKTIANKNKKGETSAYVGKVQRRGSTGPAPLQQVRSAKSIAAGMCSSCFVD